MEYWDLYNDKREKLGRTVKRGDVLQKDEYHLVVNAWIKNSKNEFLITQRSNSKSFPGKWECTGGSVVSGEDSLASAVREIEEEIGIKIDKESAKLVGTTIRHFVNCPDILDVWMFFSDISLGDVKLQTEEVSDIMWASKEVIKELYQQNKFEANAFFEEALNYNLVD